MILNHGTNIDFNKIDLKTGLYLESPAYIYSYLQDELKGSAVTA